MAEDQDALQPGQPDLKALQPQGFWDNLLHRVAPDWAERRAVENLAHKPDTIKAARTLAEIVVHYENSPWRAIAFKGLQQMTDQRCINQVCEIWAASRHPELAQLLVEQGWIASEPPALKILTTLNAGRVETLTKLNRETIRLIWQACSDSDEAFVQQAQAYLSQMQAQTQLDAICEIWAEERDPFLWELIQARSYLPQSPISLQVLVGLKLGRLDLFAEGMAGIVSPLVDACSDRDPGVAEAAKQVLRRLKRQEARNALCELVIEGEAPVAQELALQSAYEPTEPDRQALFCFITEQWQKYEALDADGSILSRAYAAASPALRRRLTEKVRVAGRIDYLKFVAGNDYRFGGAEIDPAEAELLVQILAANREWDKLWTLGFELPLKESARVISLLSEAGWLPDREEERAIFQELKVLAATRQEYDSREINRNLLPLAVFRARARVPGRINALAFSPARPLIAIGTGTGQVVLWDLLQAKRELTLSSFEHSVGRLVFTGANILACAERTGTEIVNCNLYVWPGEGRNLIKLGQHKGPITSLLAFGETGLVTTGRDQKISLWDAAARTHHKTGQLDNWVRAACISPDGQQMAWLSDRTVNFLALPGLKSLGQQTIGGSGLGRTMLFTPDSTALVFGKYTKGLGLCLNKKEGWRNVRNLPGGLSEITGQVQALAIVPGSGLILVATSDGTVRFMNWGDNPTLAGTIQAGGTRLTSLTVSPDGAFMALGDSDASFTLWDLRALELGSLFERPLAQATPRQLAALTALLESKAELPTSLKALLNFTRIVLRYRFNANQVGETPQIQAGEFEIEAG